MTRQPHPYGIRRRTLEVLNEDVDTLRALKVFWDLHTDSQVLRKLLADYGRPALYDAHNNVDELRAQLMRSRRVTVEQQRSVQ